MTHLLDRPAWSALTGPHADLADGGALARRYRPGTVPFAAARDNSIKSLARPIQHSARKRRFMVNFQDLTLEPTVAISATALSPDTLAFQGVTA